VPKDQEDRSALADFDFTIFPKIRNDQKNDLFSGGNGVLAGINGVFVGINSAFIDINDAFSGENDLLLIRIIPQNP
jgi:hypothetical protein